MSDPTTFIAIAVALRPYISDTYDLLNAATAVEDALPTIPMTDHDQRVALAVRSEEIRNFLAVGRPIPAIKELRYLANCGLKEARDAIKDPRLDLYRAQR